MEAVYRSYYTNSDPLVEYMVRQLDPKPTSYVLEPCAGEGVFVDALLSRNPRIRIDAYELNPAAVRHLAKNCNVARRVVITRADTITDVNLTLRANMGPRYDRIIGNPPYGGWQDYVKRKELKKLYPGMYVKETYSLFLQRCVSLLEPRGVLVFIIPDTYLNLHMHTTLRRLLLTSCKIREIAVFPSSFFPGVRYGYAKMSIITLERATSPEQALANTITIRNNLRNPTDLLARAGAARTSQTVHQRVVFENIDHALFMSKNSRVADAINGSKKSIADVAACVTGLYTGNNKEFLRPLSHGMRNASGYKPLHDDLICRNYCGRSKLLEGLRGNRCFIPIVKGGRTRFCKADTWFVDWSIAAVRAYRTHPKARFQNSGYYFRSGVAVPMVSSSSVSASLLFDRVFDQSIVGVFPFQQRWLFYLLAFFNSSTCTQLLRTINPSANNSANYIKKLPFICPPPSLHRSINRLAQDLFAQVRNTATFDSAVFQELQDHIADVYEL